MILHADRYFEHHYDVKNDLVSINWPTIETIYLPEILHSVSILVENVVNYNIRNLLIDASEADLHASHEEANEVVFLLTNGLAKSRLEKLGRVESSNASREIILRQMVLEMNQRYQYQTRFFRDTASARRWLEAGNSFMNY
ncbi:hypothetical protein I5M27_08530 [Adhaeribacter sp. BT258]|uniref:SpoIIAA-like n=1 Tax=Adhaeribacter terrigena TaxID=2793070 RepID=A0ABS1C0W0_9BACT|nr:hypothetical protein [Adhaeribacter terrigena]MBK0403031.1 hypothetical protein [Adhaeribacter terrigena]